MRKRKFKDGQVLTEESLSPHIERTREGYLLCKDVPISRVGEFEYTPLEAGIRGKGGKVILTRSPEELFSPETIASFELKPVVIGHDRFADPNNWKEISVGIVKNVRQGQDAEKGLLLADLLITAKEGIDLVESKKLREVSCGYDSMTVDDGDGRGHQEGIVGNHVALVSRARCGSVCSVRDGFMTKGNLKTMLRRLFRDGEEDRFNEALDGLEVKECGDEGETTSAPAPQPTAEEVLKTLVAQVAELVKRVEAIESAKVADQDDQPPADTGPVVDEEAQVVPDEEAQQVIADAEEIAPGMQKPACDSADGHFTRGLIRRVQRNALKIAGVKKFGDTASMTGQVLDIAFKAAVDAHRAGRNPMPRIGDGSTKPQQMSLNDRFKQFWNK